MYRIKKVLNHNTVIAIQTDDNQEYLIMGKGIGFGKKVSERIDAGEGDAVYSLQSSGSRGDARELARAISPECLEIANEVLSEAEKLFGKVDRSILFPMADHIEFAVKRMKNQEQISNPLTEDIRVLFHMEFKAASCIVPIMRRRMNLQIEEDEVGYIALHIHSAIEDEKVSQAMQMARSVRECISLVEQEIEKPIDVMSLSYNRLMNHIRYMVARAASGESLKVNMNDYISIKFPEAFQTAKSICQQIEKNLNCTLEDIEIGYLALHIERVTSDELDHP